MCKGTLYTVVAAANRERLWCPLGVSSHILNCLSDADTPHEEERIVLERVEEKPRDYSCLQQQNGAKMVE